MTTTLTLSTDTHFILMREYSAIESMEICKIKCTIVRVKVKGFWLLNLQLKSNICSEYLFVFYMFVVCYLQYKNKKTDAP